MYAITLALPSIAGNNAEIRACDGEDCAAVFCVGVEGVFCGLVVGNGEHSWHSYWKDDEEMGVKSKRKGPSLVGRSI